MVDISKLKDSDFHIQFIKYIIEKDYTLYLIELVSKNDNSFAISFSERYSVLEGYHEKFKKESKSNNYPTFPPKRIFGNSEPKFLSQRLSSLQNYFENILSHKDFSKLTSVREWIAELFKKYYKPPKKESNKIESNESKGMNGGKNNIEREKTITNEIPSKVNNSNTNEGSRTMAPNKNTNKQDYYQEVMNKYSKVVDNYTKQFVDLNEETHQTIQGEEERSKEKKYNAVINSGKIKTSLFSIPLGNDSNFELLGGIEDEIADEVEKGLDMKIYDFSKNLDLKIANLVNSEGIVSSII